MIKYNVVSTPSFKIMLSETLKYYSNFSTLFSYAILKEFEDTCKIISMFPYIAPKFNNNENIRKIIIKNRFVVIYKIDGEQIKLRYFIDGRMQNNNLELNEQIEMVYVV